MALVAGLALAVGPIVVWATEADAPVAPAPAAVPAPALAAPAAPVVVAAPADAPAVPVRVRLPTLGVDASVAPVGVDETGRMAVPYDVRTVGWYRFGPGPGATGGSAVLSGHVDDRDQGYGAFHRLGDLAAGDEVAVDLADGRTVAYRVTATSRSPKAQLPVDEVFARDGPARLTLITCGGAFDRDARGYTENVVVEARPDAP